MLTEFNCPVCGEKCTGTTYDGIEWDQETGCYFCDIPDETIAKSIEDALESKREEGYEIYR